MPQMLTPQMQHLLDERLKAGGYGSADDLVRAGLSALAQQEDLLRLDGDALDAAFPGARERIRRGLAQARAGQLSDGDAFFDELDREG
jgi:Arc/MetJ-type ribon-helix-helix transcriptional regulator